jgi:hypothetical protein
MRFSHHDKKKNKDSSRRVVMSDERVLSEFVNFNLNNFDK